MPAPVNERVQQLRANSLIVGRFMHMIVPILIDVYAATVSVPLRIKTLTGILKAASYLDGEELETVLHVSYPQRTHGPWYLTCPN